VCKRAPTNTGSWDFEHKSTVFVGFSVQKSRVSIGTVLVLVVPKSLVFVGFFVQKSPVFVGVFAQKSPAFVSLLEPRSSVFIRTFTYTQHILLL